MSVKDVYKLYAPIDGVHNRTDFEIWYEDNLPFCTVHGESGWKSEKDRVQLLGPTGGQIARIKPDFKALTYDVRVDKWTYVLKTYTIYEHYFFEGMMWKMYGSLKDAKQCFYNQDSRKKDVIIYRLDNWKDRGPCLEIRIRDRSKLRPAAAAVVAVMIKEDFEGLSLGEGDPERNLLVKLKDYFFERGYTKEEIDQLTAEGRNEIVRTEKIRKSQLPDPKKK